MQLSKNVQPTMSSLDKYQKLIMQHAYYSDLIRDLKAEGCEQAALCLGVDPIEEQLGSQPYQPRVDPFTFEAVDSVEPNSRVGCIKNAFDSFRDANRNAYGCDGFDFEEIWEELAGEGLVCQHCIEVRRLKAERMKAIAHLGAVRAAMTKMGRKLAQGGES